jgi:hypothetical protein
LINRDNPRTTKKEEMAANEPVAARPFIAGEQRPLPSWREERRRLADGAPAGVS